MLPPRLWPIRLPVLCLALVLAASQPAAGPADAADAVELSTVRLRLNVEQPRQERVGRLVWRGGVEIASPDSRVGGLSGLLVAADGSRMTAVSDRGHWLSARLHYDDEGWLSGLDQGQIGPLRGPDGQPLVAKDWQDAESLAVSADGAYLVGFERRHRILRYQSAEEPLSAAPTAVPDPPGLGEAPENGGLEALTSLADGRILAITEELMDDDDLTAYLRRGQAWSRLTYRRQGRYRPTGATRLPNGDIVVLERRYRPPLNLKARLTEIRAAAIRPGARLEGRKIAELAEPLSVDNFEGIAARRGPDGETLIYLLSDDNFNPLQRTLLFMFALED